MDELSEIFTDEDREIFSRLADGIGTMTSVVQSGLATSTTLRVVAGHLREGAELFDDLAQRLDDRD